MEIETGHTYYRARACCYAFSISLPLFLAFISTEIISLVLYSQYNPTGRRALDLFQFLTPVMGALGSLMAIKLINYGRRRTTMVMCAVVSFFSFLGFLPFENLAYHIAIKLILGLVLGYFAIQPLYFIYEIAPGTERGWMIGISNLVFSLSSLYLSILQYLIIEDRDWFQEQDRIISLKDHTLGTKTLISFTIYYIPIFVPWLVIFVFSCVYQRETPAFLLQNGRFAEVKPALSQIYRNVSIESKINDIISEESFDQSRRRAQPCMTRAKLRAFVVCIVVTSLGQLSGYHAIQVNLAEQNSPNKLNMSTFAILANAVEALGTVTFILFMSHVPRKILLVGGMLVLSSCEATLICFTLNPSDQTAAFTVFVSCMFLYIYGITVRNIGYIIIVEMLEFKLGAVVMALTYLFSLLVNLIQFTTRTIYDLQNITNITILYCAFNMIGVLVVMFLMNETNYKRREEVLEEYRKRASSSSEQLRPGTLAKFSP